MVGIAERAQTLHLRLNPAVELAPFADKFRSEGMVQIPLLFEDGSAESLRQLLTQNTPWRLTILEDGKPMSYSLAGIQQLGGQPVLQAKLKKVHEAARKQGGYCFYQYPMSQARFQGWDIGHPIHQLTDFLNTDAFLDIGRAITGEPRINKAEAMASLYAPGHFLTRHIDHGSNGERRAAYVIGMTRDWQADWGGLLLFYNERKDVIAGFTPRYNVITIFDTKYEHAVSQVANFAGAGRYSIAGWFRDDPAEKVF